jgi:hypothetical protein
LKIQVSRSAAEVDRSQAEAARVALADLVLSVRPDRSIIGRAVYQTVPDSGRLLSIELPAGSSPLWATVDSNPAILFRSSPRTWSIALEGRPQATVCLIWKADPAPAPSSAAPLTQPIMLPKAGAGPVRTLLTFYTPTPWGVSGGFGSFERASMARLEMARADWMAHSINEFRTKLDRSSGRDHERLVSFLINFEMALRSAERSARWSEWEKNRTPMERAARDAGMVQSTRRAVAEALQTAGLAADLASAQSYLGQSTARRSRPFVAIPEASDPSRIRLFGHPTTLMGVMPGIDEPSPPIPLTLESRPGGDSPNRNPAPYQLTVVLAFLMGIILVRPMVGVYPAANYTALALALGLAGYAGGPTLLAGGLGLAVLARPKGRGGE